METNVSKNDLGFPIPQNATTRRPRSHDKSKIDPSTLRILTGLRRQTKIEAAGAIRCTLRFESSTAAAALLVLFINTACARRKPVIGSRRLPEGII
jgi:hypothetical protein